MRTKTAILCAVVLLTAQIITFAQKTEVSVKKGKVIAQTGTTSVAIEAGRKAVLTPDRNPVVSVDDSMVDDVMEISKWVEAEKQAQREKIESSGIQILRIDDERLIKLNLRSKSPVDVQKIAQAFGGGGHKFASGCTIKGSLKEAEEAVLKQVKKAMGAI